MKTILHLTSSRFLGGPERQMLGLAQALTSWHTAFASFSEQGLCRDFLNAGKRLGCFAHELANDTPHLLAAIREVKQLVQSKMRPVE